MNIFIRLNTLVLLFFIATVSVDAQPEFHPQAHAHNDYENTRPFLDAFTNGFTSVEADVH